MSARRQSLPRRGHFGDLRPQHSIGGWAAFLRQFVGFNLSLLTGELSRHLQLLKKSGVYVTKTSFCLFCRKICKDSLKSVRKSGISFINMFTCGFFTRNTKKLLVFENEFHHAVMHVNCAGCVIRKLHLVVLVATCN
jgi:hypothetical protein